MDKGVSVSSKKNNNKQTQRGFLVTSIVDSSMHNDMLCGTKLFEGNLAHTHILIHTHIILTSQVIEEEMCHTGVPSRRDWLPSCGECGHPIASSYQFLQGECQMQRFSPPKVTAHTW